MNSVWGVLSEERKGFHSFIRVLRHKPIEGYDSGEAERKRRERRVARCGVVRQIICGVCLMFERLIWSKGLLRSAVPCIVGMNGWSRGAAMPLPGS